MHVCAVETIGWVFLGVDNLTKITCCKRSCSAFLIMLSREIIVNSAQCVTVMGVVNKIKKISAFSQLSLCLQNWPFWKDWKTRIQIYNLFAFSFYPFFLPPCVEPKKKKGGETNCKKTAVESILLFLSFLSPLEAGGWVAMQLPW